MNEGMMVYLNLNLNPGIEQHLRNNEILSKLDELLLSEGMVYSGVQNLYHAQNQRERDSAAVRAIKALRNAEWLKGIYRNAAILDRTDVRSLEEIKLEGMSVPSVFKQEYYENYYLQKKKCSHGIVVDENGRLRDGYIAYLLAQKYGFCPVVYEAWSEQPLWKTVAGRHVYLKNGITKICSRKVYQWIYSLRTPVVKGDILLAKTKIGYSPMVVDNISYMTGTEFLRAPRRIKKKLADWDQVQWEEGWEAYMHTPGGIEQRDFMCDKPIGQDMEKSESIEKPEISMAASENKAP